MTNQPAKPVEHRCEQCLKPIKVINGTPCRLCDDCRREIALRTVGDLDAL